MAGYAINRLLYAVPALMVASVIVFGAMRLLPGDPVDALFPADASVSADARANLRQQLGLDEPLPAQYLLWFGRILHGDLGTSVRLRQPVAALIAQRAPHTVELVVLSTILACAIALPAGTLAAARRGGMIDHAATLLALLGLSIPGFALGVLLALVVGVWWHLVPTVGNLVLPVVTLATATAGVLVRQVRSGVVDELNREYVRTAEGKGLGRMTTLARHALPNALSPTIGVLAAVVGYELGGAIVIEQVFGWPGLGLLLFESVSGRDYAVVQALALLGATAFILVNLAADVLRVALDPRLRGSGG